MNDPHSMVEKGIQRCRMPFNKILEELFANKPG
jgi:hypothetical protein